MTDDYELSAAEWLDQERLHERELAIAKGRLVPAMAMFSPNSTAPERPATFTDGATFILGAAEDVPAVWGVDDEILWAEGEPLRLCGPIGAGKTTVLAQLALARLGFTKELLGFPVAAGDRRVLYLTCDRPKQIARAFRRLVTPDHADLLRDRMRFIVGPPPGDIAANPDRLVRWATEADAGTVIIDSLKDTALRLSDDETGSGVNRAFQLVVAEGIELAVSHHQRKGQAGGGKPKSIEDVYGSTWIPAGCGTVLLLWGDPGAPLVELSTIKPSVAEIGSLWVEHDHDAGTSSVVSNRAEPLVLLRGAPQGLSIGEAAAVMFNTARATDAERKRAERKLNRLVGQGLAYRQDQFQDPGGKFAPARYHATIADPK